MAHGLGHAVARNQVRHSILTGEVRRKSSIFYHLHYSLAKLPQFLDFFGFSGTIVSIYYPFLRVPKAIFFSNRYNLMYLIYVKVSTGAVVVFQ